MKTVSKMKSIKMSRKIRRRKLVGKEGRVSKCLVMGSSNSSLSTFIKSFQNYPESYLSLSENEATFRLDQTDLVLWGGHQLARLKRTELRQYLAYHSGEVLFYLVNEADIEVS